MSYNKIIIGRLLPMFRNNVSVPPSKILQDENEYNGTSATFFYVLK